MSVNQHTKWVTLSRSPTTADDTDGFWEDLDPSGVWASLQPSFGGSGERSNDVVLETRFHPQLTVDCRVSFEDPMLNRTRTLLVQSVQNVDEKNDLMRALLVETAP